MNEIKFEKLIKLLAKAQMTISITVLGILVIINLYEISIRMLFDKSMVWIQEISVLFMVWMIFCGFTKIVYDKKNISIDLLTSKFHGKTRVFMEIFSQIMILGFLVIFTYYGYFLLLKQIGIGTLTCDIPRVLYTFPVILNSCSVVLIYINELYKNIYFLINGGEREWK